MSFAQLFASISGSYPPTLPEGGREVCQGPYNIDPFGHNFINLGCGTGIDGTHSGTHRRHKNLARVFADILHEAGVPEPILEPKALPGSWHGCRQRGEGIFSATTFPRRGGAASWTYAFQQFSTRTAICGDQLTCSQATWLSRVQQRRGLLMHSYFRPFPSSLFYETHGRACESASQFLVTAATAAAKIKLGYDAVDESQIFIRQRNCFLGRWCKFLSVCLQRSIAGQISHGRSAGLDLGPAGFLNMEYADEFQEFT